MGHVKVGCHVSIRDGYLEAAKHAQALGANAFQYFPKNPRRLGVKAFDQHDAELCKQFCLEHHMVSIAHTPYPTNLAAKGEKEKWVIDSLLNDLIIAEACGSVGTVVHFGTTHEGPLSGYQQMIHILNEVLMNWCGTTLLLIENNAGKGDQLGTTLEELVKIRELTYNPGKIGFCLDTCHAFASDLWHGDNWHEVLERGQELDYLPHIKAVHFNNSVYPNGSRKDRHASIAEGEIPWKTMQDVLLTPVFEDIPFILETPNSDDWPYEKEIQLMKACF